MLFDRRRQLEPARRRFLQNAFVEAHLRDVEPGVLATDVMTAFEPEFSQQFFRRVIKSKNETAVVDVFAKRVDRLGSNSLGDREENARPPAQRLRRNAARVDSPDREPGATQRTSASRHDPIVPAGFVDVENRQSEPRRGERPENDAPVDRAAPPKRNANRVDFVPPRRFAFRHITVFFKEIRRFAGRRASGRAGHRVPAGSAFKIERRGADSLRIFESARDREPVERRAVGLKRQVERKTLRVRLRRVI